MFSWTVNNIDPFLGTLCSSWLMLSVGPRLPMGKPTTSIFGHMTWVPLLLDRPPTNHLRATEHFLFAPCHVLFYYNIICNNMGIQCIPVNMEAPTLGRWPRSPSPPSPPSSISRTVNHSSTKAGLLTGLPTHVAVYYARVCWKSFRDRYLRRLRITKCHMVEKAWVYEIISFFLIFSLYFLKKKVSPLTLTC